MIARILSLVVLLALLVLIAALSFEVMATFILPLFLAVMLSVLFKPVQVWISKRCKNRPRLAAGLTTTLVLLAVLLPSMAVGALAVSETADLVASLDRDDISRKLTTLRNRLRLGPPPKQVMGALDRLRKNVDQLEQLAFVAPDAEPKPPSEEELRKASAADNEIVESRLNLAEPSKVAAPAATGDVPVPSPQLMASWAAWKKSLAEQKPAPADREAWHSAWERTRSSLEQFRTELLGGPLVASVKQVVRVDDETIDGAIARIRTSAGPLALGTTQYLGGLIWEIGVGLIVMLLGLYYFLADGASMIDAVVQLTPLDQKHTQRLITDFGDLTRAIVLSMVLAAVVQGLLAGVGYLFVGLNSVFLLTLLTILFAMVPLVGATLVWGGCCAWLYFFEQRTGAALGLAIYCAIVVGLADNLIKPLVLQERSNLHPLPALLSVLGGAQALGPIGVFVGPMVLALLHTLLVMLHGELKNWDLKKDAGATIAFTPPPPPAVPT